MAIWERYQRSSVLGAVGSHVDSELLENEAAAENFQSADLVIVDGIVTIVADQPTLCGVRLLILDAEDTSQTEDDPEPHHPAVYYTWFAGLGVQAFRLRSKKTLPPEHKLWLQTWKAGGTTTTNVHVGLMLYIQLKH